MLDVCMYIFFPRRFFIYNRDELREEVSNIIMNFLGQEIHIVISVFSNESTDLRSSLAWV